MQKIEIPNYIRHIELSKKRQAKYYEKGKVIPKAKKYFDRALYDYKPYPGFGTRLFLTDLSTNERIVANPRAVGTPRILTINGQKIYNGEVNKQVRNKVLLEIKESFKPYIEQLTPIVKFPIKITCEFHDVIRDSGSGSLWDLDNRSWPYIKAFQDCLTGDRKKNKKILGDDNILYITQPPVPKFIPVDREEDRKLVFIIQEETDKRILNHKGYRAELQLIQTRAHETNF